MTQTDLMNLVREKVAQIGQAAAARELDYSASALNQVLHGKYVGNVDNFLARVRERWSHDLRACPVLGDITYGRCAEERAKPFSAASPMRVRLSRACERCPR